MSTLKTTAKTKTALAKTQAQEKVLAPLPLSEKERAILAFIEQCLAETGGSPSYQEIKDHFGFASFNSVQNYLKQLTAKGYIQIPTNQKRAIQVVQNSSALQQTFKEPPRRSLLHTPGEREEVLSLPLLGKVAAGAPLEHFENNEFIDVAPSFVRNPGKSFALKVAGQSMIDDGIFDGDIIIVQKQATAANGEIVVATVDNESTVKRFFLKSERNSNETLAFGKPNSRLEDKWVELRPANPTMQSMWYKPQQVEIQGVVVGLIRKF
jgi:repressor LexA